MSSTPSPPVLHTLARAPAPAPRQTIDTARPILLFLLLLLLPCSIAGQFSCGFDEPFILEMKTIESHRIATTVAFQILRDYLHCPVNVSLSAATGALDILSEYGTSRSSVNLVVETTPEISAYLHTASLVSLGLVGFTHQQGWFVGTKVVQQYPDLMAGFWRSYTQRNVIDTLSWKGEHTPIGTCLHCFDLFQRCQNRSCVQFYQPFNAATMGVNEALSRGLGIDMAIAYLGSDFVKTVRALLDDGTPFLFHGQQPSSFIASLDVKRVFLPPSCPLPSTRLHGRGMWYCDYPLTAPRKVITKELQHASPVATAFLSYFYLQNSDMEWILGEVLRIQADMVDGGAFKGVDGDDTDEAEQESKIINEVISVASRRWIQKARPQWETWIPKAARVRTTMVVRSCNDSFAAPFVLPQDFNSSLDYHVWDEIHFPAFSSNWPWRDWKQGDPLPFKDLLRSLETGDTDLAMCGVHVTLGRAKRFEFSRSYWEGSVRVAYLPQDPVVKLAQSIFTPFLFFTFSAVLGLSVVAGHLMWMVERNTNSQFPREYRSGVWIGFWWAFVTVTTIGYGDRFPKTRAGQNLALIWMLLGLVFFSSLTGSVTSVLVTSEYTGHRDRDSFKTEIIGVIANEYSNSYNYSLTEFALRTTFETVYDALVALKAGEIGGVVYDGPTLYYYSTLQYSDDLNTSIFPPELSSKFVVSEWTLQADFSYAYAMPKGAPWAAQLSQVLLQNQQQRKYSLESKFFLHGHEGLVKRNALTADFWLWVSYVLLIVTVVVALFAAFFFTRERHTEYEEDTEATYTAV